MADGAGDLISHARELERRDSDVATRLDAIASVLAEVDALRARAARIRDAVAAVPADAARVRALRDEAAGREVAARRELADAALRVEEVGRSKRLSDAAREEADRGLRRATLAATDAAAAVARIDDRLEALAREELSLDAEAEELVLAARTVADLIAAVPRLSESGRVSPGTSLDAIEEWGARVHAALFVVRGGLESERERIVLEANGLAAAALGEEVAGASVTLVRKRLEESLTGS